MWRPFPSVLAHPIPWLPWRSSYVEMKGVEHNLGIFMDDLPRMSFLMCQQKTRLPQQLLASSCFQEPHSFEPYAFQSSQCDRGTLPRTVERKVGKISCLGAFVFNTGVSGMGHGRWVKMWYPKSRCHQSDVVSEWLSSTPDPGWINPGWLRIWQLANPKYFSIIMWAMFWMPYILAPNKEMLTPLLTFCLRAHRFCLGAYLVVRGAYAGLRAPQFCLRHTLTRGSLLNMNTRV